MISPSFLLPQHEYVKRVAARVMARFKKIIYKGVVFSLSRTSSRYPRRSSVPPPHTYPHTCVLSFLIELKHFPNAIPFHPWHVAEVFIYKYQRRRLRVDASARELAVDRVRRKEGRRATTRRCSSPSLLPSPAHINLQTLVFNRLLEPSTLA